MGSNTGDVNSGTAAVATIAKLCIKKTINVKIVSNTATVMSITTPRECWYCPMEAGGTMSWVILKF